ncbi:hypothetical protein Fmac_000943 [Flemingia macrophylla]|uniref:Uncharacterized protein n=1 Tax=Flemingia macrophylla TaxID=520843 RepID=A0ABD1NGD9_9FABA
MWGQRSAAAQISVTRLTEWQSDVVVSVDNNAPYALCTTKLSTLLSYLTGPTVGNVSDYRAYTAIYAPSFSDQYDPTSLGTSKCLFGLNFSSHSSGKRRTILISLVSVFCFLALLLFFALWAYLRCKKRRGLLARGKETVLASGLDSMNQSTTLISIVVVRILGSELSSKFYASVVCKYKPKVISGKLKQVASLRFLREHSLLHCFSTLHFFPLIKSKTFSGEPHHNTPLSSYYVLHPRQEENQK